MGIFHGYGSCLCLPEGYKKPQKIALLPRQRMFSWFLDHIQDPTEILFVGYTKYTPKNSQIALVSHPPPRKTTTDFFKGYNNLVFREGHLTQDSSMRNVSLLAPVSTATFFPAIGLSILTRIESRRDQVSSDQNPPVTFHDTCFLSYFFKGGILDPG